MLKLDDLLASPLAGLNGTSQPAAAPMSEGAKPRAITLRHQTGAAELAEIAPAPQAASTKTIAAPATYAAADPREIRAFAERYAGVAPKKLDRPVERGMRWLAKVDGMLRAEGSLDALTESAMKADLRRYVFLVEGFLRLYRDRSDAVMQCYTSLKELEDTLGDYSYWRGLAASIEKLAGPAEVKEKLATYVARERDQAMLKTKQLLFTQWMPSQEDGGQIPGIARTLDALRRFDFDDYSDDRKFLRSTIAGHVGEVGKLAKTLDYSKLETGIHELRCQVRWIPIYAEAVDGLFAVDVTRNPVKAYEPLLATELATSKYLVLPAPTHEEKPVRISSSLYTAVAKLVLDLGAIKDRGEEFEGLVHALLESGVTKNKDEAHGIAYGMLGRDNSGLQSETEKLVDELRRNGLFKAFERELSR